MIIYLNAHFKNYVSQICFICCSYRIIYIYIYIYIILYYKTIVMFMEQHRIKFLMRIGHTIKFYLCTITYNHVISSGDCINVFVYLRSRIFLWFSKHSLCFSIFEHATKTIFAAIYIRFYYSNKNNSTLSSYFPRFFVLEFFCKAAANGVSRVTIHVHCY